MNSRDTTTHDHCVPRSCSLHDANNSYINANGASNKKKPVATSATAAAAAEAAAAAAAGRAAASKKSTAQTHCANFWIPKQTPIATMLNRRTLAFTTCRGAQTVSHALHARAAARPSRTHIEVQYQPHEE